MLGRIIVLIFHQKKNCNDDLKELYEAHTRGDLDFMTYLDRKENIHSRFMALDKKVMEKRKMMLDIEKENIMTIQSALRSIPKKPEEKNKSAMAEFLSRRQNAQ